MRTNHAFPIPSTVRVPFLPTDGEISNVNKFQLQLAAQPLLQRKVKALQYQQLTAFKISYYLEVEDIALKNIPPE